jgi:uncharacterized phage-associated protein
VQTNFQHNENQKRLHPLGVTAVSVFSVARYILNRTGPISAMKLQKLVYYAQAWSLVWDESPLFNEPIEAWANGPVVPSLYTSHRGKYLVAEADYDNYSVDCLSADQRETINAVLTAYAGKSPQWLSDQTHSELPWRQARSGLADGERGDRVITLDSMAEYYCGLQ